MLKILLISSAALLISLRHSNKIGIVGLWQINSSKVADALHDTYKFYEDGSFTFDFDQYDDTKRIVSIGGEYRKNGDMIYFTVFYRKELIDGRIVRGSPGFQKGWVLIEGKQITVKEQYTEEAAIEICDNSAKEITCIKIDNEKFYKLSDDPDDPNFK